MRNDKLWNWGARLSCFIGKRRQPCPYRLDVLLGRAAAWIAVIFGFGGGFRLGGSVHRKARFTGTRLAVALGGLTGIMWQTFSRAFVRQKLTHAPSSFALYRQNRLLAKNYLQESSSIGGNCALQSWNLSKSAKCGTSLSCLC